jgi:predicted Holliday junction resolvase-like endonuclease
MRLFTIINLAFLVNTVLVCAAPVDELQKQRDALNSDQRDLEEQYRREQEEERRRREEEERHQREPGLAMVSYRRTVQFSWIFLPSMIDII